MHRTAFRVGAIAWIFTGVAHDILEFAIPGNPAAEAVLHASVVHIGPIGLRMDALTRGVSLAMGLAMVVVGVLLLMINRSLAADPGKLRPYGVVSLAASVALLGLAVVLIPGPPLLTFAVATVAFAISLLAKGKRAAAPPAERAVIP